MSSTQLLARLDRIPIWPYPQRLLWVIGIGFFFAFFDTVSIGLALPKIQAIFSIPLTTASWSITSSLMGYILGSLVIARISDRYGRRIALYISILFFSIGSLYTAFATSFDDILFWRFITGIGIGAEISEVSTYLGEMSPASCRGRYTSLGVAWGFFGFAVVPFVAFALIPHFNWGWRMMFLIGGLGAMVIAIMRRHLPDSPRWLIQHNRLTEAETIIAAAEERAGLIVMLPSPSSTVVVSAATNHRFLQLFKAPFGYRILLFMSIWFIYYIGNYAWLTLGTSLLNYHGFSLAQSLGFVAIASLGFIIGPLLAVYLGDRIERKYSICSGCLVWIISLLGVGLLPHDFTIIVCSFFAATSIGFMIPLMYTYTTEHFPTETRATSVALTDGFGHLGGAFCGQIVLGISFYFSNHFAAAFILMALSGLITLILMSFGKSMTRQSLAEIKFPTTTRPGT